MKMKSKQNAKKKAEANNAGPGTPDKGSNTPAASPAGSTSSTGSSMNAAVSAALNIRAETVGAGNTGGTTSKANAKSKGAKDADKGGAVGSIKAGYPSLTSFTHFDLVNFPKINLILNGTKSGTAIQASTSGPGSVGAVGSEVKSENLSMDDVDMLQTELETLWSSVAMRIRNLNREAGGVQSATTGSHHFDPQHQEKIAAVATIIDHGTRTSVSAAAKLVMGAQLGIASSPSPGPSPSASTSAPAGAKKAGNAKGERQPKKKLKGEGSGLGKSSKKGDKPAARATQNRSHSVSSDLGSESVVKHHHEVPNQFWESTEPFFREITTDDLDNLEKLIDEHNDFPKELMEIPPLGKHYKDDEETAKKKAKEYHANSGNDHVGPLAQRLVSALVDDRVAMHRRNHPPTPSEAASTATSAGTSNSAAEGGFIHRQGLARALGLDGGRPTAGPSADSSLESRIRDILLENSLLSPEDMSDPLLMNPEDEILAEIVRTQGNLKQLHDYNAIVLQRFKAIGKHEMERQIIQREVDKADKDVLEAYKTISQLRLKKKPVTKKEKDAATKALEARKKALIKLEMHGRKNKQVHEPGPSPTSSSLFGAAALRVDV